MFSIVGSIQLSGEMKTIKIVDKNPILHRFDTESSLWRARSISNPRFSATSEAPLEELLLGTNSWTVYNDSSSCSDSEAYTRDK